jgi:hypothetical protein
MNKKCLISIILAIVFSASLSISVMGKNDPTKNTAEEINQEIRYISENMQSLVEIQNQASKGTIKKDEAIAKLKTLMQNHFNNPIFKRIKNNLNTFLDILTTIASNPDFLQLCKIYPLYHNAIRDTEFSKILINAKENPNENEKAQDTAMEAKILKVKSIILEIIQAYQQSTSNTHPVCECAYPEAERLA